MSKRKFDEYSYAAFVDYHEKSRPHRPNNPDNFLLQQTKPGHETNRFTNKLSILNELMDNDIRAASDTPCEITLNIYKEEEFGKNILRTYAAGPGHGQENAQRFCQRGDVDEELSRQLKLGASWYGNGQKDAMQEISCYSIAVSVSKALRPDTWDVHVHVFQFLGWNRVHTLHYEYYCTDGVWTLNLRNKNHLQCFLETSAPTFLKTEDNIKTLIREESPNAETGVTRLMLGLRGFEELLVDRRKINALVTSIKKTHVCKKNITYNIFGVEFQPNTSLEDNIVTEKKFEFENFTLKLGKRRVPSPKAKEPQDAILEGPIFVLGNRIMQFDYNSFYKSKYDDEDPGAVALFYYRKYVNDARNNHGAIVKQFRLYTDLFAIIDLKNAGICSTTTTRVKPKAGRQILNDINEPIRGYVRDLPEPENLKLYNLYTRTAAGSSSSSGSSSSGSSGSNSSGSNSSGSSSSGNSSSGSSGSNSSVSSGSNSSVSSGSNSSGSSSSGSSSSGSSGINSSVSNSSGSSSSGNSSSVSSGSNSSGSSGSNSSGSSSSGSSGSSNNSSNNRKRKKKRKTPSNKKQCTLKMMQPTVSSESRGFLYCYTLEDSSDWKDVSGKTIYKWGLTKDESLEHYIRHSHGCKHPTKKIRHVCSWSHVPLVAKVEHEVLQKMQNSTDVTQFATPATTKSEYFTTVLDEPTLCVWLEERIREGLQREMQIKEAELSSWQVVSCFETFNYS